MRSNRRLLLPAVMPALVWLGLAAGCGSAPEEAPEEEFDRVVKDNLAALNPLLGRWDLRSHTIEGPGGAGQRTAVSGTFRFWPTLDGSYVEFWTLLRFESEVEKEKIEIWRGLLAHDGSGEPRSIRFWSFGNLGYFREGRFPLEQAPEERSGDVLDLEGDTEQGTMRIEVDAEGILRLRYDDAPGTDTACVRTLEFEKR